MSLDPTAQGLVDKAVAHIYRQAHVDARRYMDRFIQLKCAPDMLAMGLYPNTKEIQESFSAFEFVTKTLGHRLLADPSVALLAVGDGSTPRTGAMFAFRSNWQVWSVDPELKDPEKWHARVRQMRCYPVPIEQFAADGGIGGSGRAVVVAVHSHAPLDAAVRACRLARRVDVFALPCCKRQELDRPPDTEETDWAIGSPAREMRYWLDVKPGVLP